MFKCTHCGKEYGTIRMDRSLPELDLTDRDGEVCSECEDGVLRPMRDECQGTPSSATLPEGAFEGLRNVLMNPHKGPKEEPSVRP